MCCAELLSSSDQSGTATPCGGSTQGNRSSSAVFHSLLSLLDLATIDEANYIFDPLNAERSVQMREPNTAAQRLDTFCWEKKTSLLRAAWFKALRCVSLFRSTDALFLLRGEDSVSRLCQTKSDINKQSRFIGPRVAAASFPSCQSGEIKTKCLAR